MIFSKPGEKFYRSDVYHDKKKNIYYARAYYKDLTAKCKYPKKQKRIPDDVSKRGKKAREAYAEEYREYMNKIHRDSVTNITIPEDDTRTVDEIVRWFLKFQLNSNDPKCSIEKSTYATQLSHWELHGAPQIGNYGFRSIDRFIITEWLTYLHSLGLKESSIYHYYKIPRKTYQYFLDEGVIERNPFDFRGAPSNRDKPNTTHLTGSQSERLFECLYKECGETDTLCRMIYLLYFAGLRRGEVCGLRWNSVNFDNGYLEVNTAIGSENGRNYTKLPKTFSSFRKFKMVDELRSYLLRVKNAVEPQGEWFVLTDSKEWMPLWKFTRVFEQFRDKYNLVDAYGNPIIPHGLRHNLGYAGIQSNLDIDSLKKIFGHANRSTTLDIYGDGSPQAMEIATNQLNEFLRVDKE